MRIKILICLVAFLWQYNSVLGQDYDKEFEVLYQKCNQTRLDSAHRLQVAFLRKHKVIETPSKFFIYCDAFREKCLKNNNQALLRRLLITEAIDKLKYKKATSAQIDEHFGKLYDEFLEAKDYSAALECLLEQGLMPAADKNSVQSIKVLFFAEKHAEKYQLLHDVNMQSVLKMIGYYLWELDIPALSIEYFKKSLATPYSTYSDSLIVLNGIGINYQKLNRFEESMRYFKQATYLTQRTNNLVFNAVVKGNMAVTLYKTGKLDSAYAYASLDKNVSLREGIRENAVGAMYWLVQIEIKRKNFGQAKVLLDSISQMMEKVAGKNFISIKRQKEAEFLYYQAIKNPEKSLAAYREFVYYDSLFQEYANKNKISELKLLAEVRIYSQEMEKKEQEKQWRSTLFGVVITVVLLLTMLIIWHFTKKVKRVESSNRAQAEEINQLRQQLYEQIGSINQQNTDFKLVINTEVAENENETLEFDTERLEAKPEDIEFLRSFNLNQKEQWGLFKASFLKVYPSFEQEITAKVGEVSNAELRLLMLHKLGLNNQEIAKTLLISAESVRTGKYRLYKKFGIGSAEELDKLI
jgi:DNA-binding CsgD family transcriptional regulator